MDYLLGVINKKTGGYLLPILPKITAEYQCPDCDDSVIFNGTSFQHEKSSVCRYYSDPTERQLAIDARLRLQHWLQKGISLSVLHPCSNKILNGKYTHSEYIGTIRLTKGDTIHLRPNGLTLYDSYHTISKILFIKTEHSTCNELYMFEPKDILRFNCADIQKNIEKRVPLDITLHSCIKQEFFCKNCVLERSSLCARQLSINTICLPDHAHKNKDMYCLICDKEVTLNDPQLKEPLIYQHKVQKSCWFYENPTKENLLLDALYKFAMFLQLRMDILLTVHCSRVECINSCILKLDYSKDDSIKVQDDELRLTIFNSKKDIQYIFSFRDTDYPNEFYIPDKQIYEFLRQNRRTYMRKTVHLDAFQRCPHCL